MELQELITKADAVNDMANNPDHSDPVRKELKKIEMYVRKSFLMLKNIELLNTGDFTEQEFLEELNTALVRDQKYVKARDSLGDYSIG